MFESITRSDVREENGNQSFHQFTLVTIIAGDLAFNG